MSRVIGLTGGIAAGKSSVSAILARKGFTVIDADAIGHELLRSGTETYDAIVENFGTEVLAADGEIDRGRLGGIVFADGAKLEFLNTITHPRICAEARMRIEALSGKPAVLDAALLIETGLYRLCSEVWLVTVDWDTRLKRLMARNGYTREEALRRMESQSDDSFKRRYAGKIIENNGTPDRLKETVLKLVAETEEICRGRRKEI